MNKSPLVTKSFNFALLIVKLCDFLSQKQKEYILSKQLLRSGTSVGANIKEATASQSRKDFISKLSIASKEARESEYWLNLLLESGKIDSTQFKAIEAPLLEVTKMLSSSISTAKKSL